MTDDSSVPEIMTKQLSGKSFSLTGTTSSPDGKHTASIVSFWNGSYRVSALFLDQKLVTWCLGIGPVVFSSDSRKMAFSVFHSEDEALEGAPGAESDHYHIFVVADFKKPTSIEDLGKSDQFRIPHF